MHELPVINSILSVVMKHAVANNVNKIVAVHLQVGEMCDLEEKWMQDYFDYLSKGGIAEGARLVIEKTPVVMKCDGCGASFNVDLKENVSLACPECGGEKYTIVSGREYYIKSMEAT
jgi:hydrogenase nickel incorporation protein HypA/HybF